MTNNNSAVQGRTNIRSTVENGTFQSCVLVLAPRPDSTMSNLRESVISTLLHHEHLEPFVRSIHLFWANCPTAISEWLRPVLGAILHKSDGHVLCSCVLSET